MGNNTSSQNNLPPSIPRSLQSPEVRDLSRAMSDDEGMGDGGFSPAYDDNEGGDYDIAEPEDPFEEHNVVDDVNASQNPDQLLATGDNGMGVISSGDPSAKPTDHTKTRRPRTRRYPTTSGRRHHT